MRVGSKLLKSRLWSAWERRGTVAGRRGREESGDAKGSGSSGFLFALEGNPVRRVSTLRPLGIFLHILLWQGTLERVLVQQSLFVAQVIFNRGLTVCVRSAGGGFSLAMGGLA
jgi:hypothetical protein